jgi:neutral ceramidase
VTGALAVGYGVAELPVPAGTELGGYADRPGPSTGVLDALQIAVLSIRSHGGRFVWVVADLPCVNTDLAAAVRAAVRTQVPEVPAEVVWVSATHTHAGPETGCSPGGAATPTAWLSAVPTAAARAAAAAVATEVPGTLQLRRLRLTGVGGQRSGARPRRTVPVELISVHRGAQRPAGVLVVLPVHPTVLAAENRLVSADLAGATRRAIGAHPAFAGAFATVVTGAAGDVSTRPHRRSQTPAECERLGSVVADAAAAAMLRPPELVVAAGRLRTASTTVRLDPRPPAAPPLGELAAALAAAERRGDPVGTRTAYTALQAARLADGAARQEERLRAVECAVGTMALGPLRLLAMGAEPYLALARAAVPAVLVGYTNGYLGYLPTHDAYRRPTYEVLRTPVARGGAERALAAGLALLALAR